ncbi:MAG: type II toxin-antitoxin system RelE/ParE family toxin [Armatimonadetes bacterium]|nr:type II toxin-antitoxin system RelE/ParE family toxin [Armatimonadota bacterium]
MPPCTVVFYSEDGKTAPVLDWLDALPPRVLDKITVRIERLAQLGHDLHRPEADTLRDGIHELRARFGTINYRVLYFFHRRTATAAILAHGLTKEDRVPDRDIDLAVRRKARFEADPDAHTYQEPLPEEEGASP